MPAVYPAAAAVNGSRMYVTKSEPATHDSAGFSAIGDSVLGDGTDGWVEVGCVISGDVPKETTEFNSVTCWSGASFQLAGGKTISTVDYELLLNPEAVGQDILEEYKDGQEIVWFKIVLPTSVNRSKAFAAKVTNVGELMGSASDALRLGFTLAPVMDVNEVGVVSFKTTP